MRAFWPREWLGSPRRQIALRCIGRVLVAAFAVSIVAASAVGANEGSGYGGANAPVYQRKGNSRGIGQDFRRRDMRFAPFPQVSAGWFQRPYPYHLDYYRMRYGGSYAPYFGNLYGPPNVVLASPYFGLYGGFGYPGTVGPNMDGSPVGFPGAAPAVTTGSVPPGE
jgi:hypothetical protein